VSLFLCATILYFLRLFTAPGKLVARSILAVVETSISFPFPSCSPQFSFHVVRSGLCGFQQPHLIQFPRSLVVACVRRFISPLWVRPKVLDPELVSLWSIFLNGGMFCGSSTTKFIPNFFTSFSVAANGNVLGTSLVLQSRMTIWLMGMEDCVYRMK
jgi:hypothetical protein